MEERITFNPVETVDEGITAQAAETQEVVENDESVAEISENEQVKNNPILRAVLIAGTIATAAAFIFLHIYSYNNNGLLFINPLW